MRSVEPKYAELASMKRGAYVRVVCELRSYRSFCSTSNPQYVWHDWKDVEIEGILTFTRAGVPKIDGEPLEHRGVECRKVFAELLFIPEPNALKDICEKCAKSHPLPKVLMDLRETYPQYNSYKPNPCSICGAPARRSLKVPSKYWKFTAATPHDEIEKDLISDQFARKMKDATANYILTQVRRSTKEWEKSKPNFEAYWTARGVGPVRTTHIDPPPSTCFATYSSFAEIKSYSEEMWIDHHKVWAKVQE